MRAVESVRPPHFRPGGACEFTPLPAFVQPAKAAGEESLRVVAAVRDGQASLPPLKPAIPLSMFFSARIGQKELAQLCRRLATGLEAGLEVRRVWAREAGSRLSPALRGNLEHVAEGINRGQTLSDALAGTGKYFPGLFHELVAVGEQTGKLDEVLKRLAEHYEHQLKLQRIFMAAIAWPMLQLTAAVMVIGLLIYVMGFITGMDGKPVDVLGFGLVGGEGVMIYFLIIFAAVAVAFAIMQAVRRGLAWTRP